MLSVLKFPNLAVDPESAEMVESVDLSEDVLVGWSRRWSNACRWDSNPASGVDERFTGEFDGISGEFVPDRLEVLLIPF